MIMNSFHRVINHGARLTAIGAATFLSGCGGSAPPPTAAQSGAAAVAPASPATTPATAGGAIQLTAGEAVAGQASSGDVTAADEAELQQLVASGEPAENSPEWLVREIARLRTAPLDAVRQPRPGQPGEFDVIQLSPEQVQQEQSRRAQECIELAMQAIAKTNKDPAREQIFNNAVHYLVDTRLQLAVAGDAEQARLLGEDADALFRRDPTSFGAVEAGSKLLQYSQIIAQRSGRPEDAVRFARQARLFAERFPQETGRTCLQLLTAARLCDDLQQTEDAVACLSVLEEKFAETPFFEQAAGMLRRLRLPGRQLVEFGGSTHDGGHVSIDQFQGQVVLIAFWASNSEQFQSHLPLIRAAIDKSQGRATVLGVNLDRDEVAVDQFLEKTGLSWKHIFYSDIEKRGLRNLVARHYGVSKVPTYWLVDARGVVRSVQVEPAQLEALLNAALAAESSRGL